MCSHSSSSALPPNLHCKRNSFIFLKHLENQLLPQCINEVWPAPDQEELTPFDISPITPSLLKIVLKKRSSNSSPGEDEISYHHLKKVPSTHFFATLFSNIVLKSYFSPTVWSKAKIKLPFKEGDPKPPSNFCPDNLTSTVGKLFLKIFAIRLERFLYSNNLIDPPAQKVFLTGINGTFEHIFSVSAILDNNLLHHLPLAMTFIDLKYAFGSVSHSYIDDILEHISLPVMFRSYISSLYSELVGFIETKEFSNPGVSFKVTLCHLISS